MKLINKIIRLFSAGVLLALAPPSTGIAGTTGGPVYGGGGTGGGLGTCPAASGICEDAAGNLVLNDKGAGVIAIPADATGSNIVLSEGGNFGTSTVTLGLGGTDLVGSVNCVLDNGGGIPAACALLGNIVGGGSPIASQNAGVALTTNTAVLNFTGAGVTASNVGTTVSIDVPGSSLERTAISVTNIPTVQDPAGDWQLITSIYRDPLSFLPSSAGGYLAMMPLALASTWGVMPPHAPNPGTCASAGVTPGAGGVGVGCNSPIGIAQVGGVSTIWDFTLTAVAVSGTSLSNCTLTVYQDNAINAGSLTLPSLTPSPFTVSTTFAVTTTAIAPNWDHYGVFRQAGACGLGLGLSVTLTAVAR